MSKKLTIIVLIIFSSIILFLLTLPFIGIALFSFMVSSTDLKQEREIKKEVEIYLEQKYQIEFNVDVEINSLGAGTKIHAFPENNQSYKFYVEQTSKNTYVDSFLNAIYKREIEMTLQEYPELKNNENLFIKMFFDNNALSGKKFDFQKSYPDLANIPVHPTFVITDKQIREEIDREEVLRTFKQILIFIQKEQIELNELKATITVEAADLYYYYHYLIPKEYFTNVATIENLELFEKVEIVKPQE